METPTSDTKPQIMEKENQVEFDLVAWVNQDEEEDEDCNESQNEDEDCNESEDEDCNESQNEDEDCNESEDEDCNESQNEDEDCNESEDEDEEVEFDLVAWVDQDEDCNEDCNESQNEDEDCNESEDEDEDCNESQNEDEDCNESEDEDEEVEFDLVAWVDQDEDEDENSNESQDKDENSNESQYKDENSNESQDEDSSSESEDESEPTPIHSYMNQINKKWDRMVMKDISPQTKHLVQFGDVKIHRLIHWQFAYQEARKSLWGQCARDSNRFHRRIQQIEPILSKILNPDHRIRIQYKLKLISSDNIPVN
ncbi:hypothetical protein Pmani_006510 [Petrolisthes manimaculis]|uniref:Uncharacterized protein n=1 Tax=Petrolisthes manimaculis TaxID=1843537 RepID=A0AAE1ULP9_9EUCA|nr:hypothetical protein Pmani_006510 [Petrolisthes manimaculis]